MKFMLITMMLANPMTYADKSTCTEAATALKQMDMEAVCIPAGIEHQSTSDKMLQNFMAMITKLEQMKTNGNAYQDGGTTKDALR